MIAGRVGGWKAGDEPRGCFRNVLPCPVNGLRYTAGMNDKWEKRFGRLRVVGLLVFLGLPFLLAVYFTSDFVRIFCGVAAFMLVLPGVVYAYVLVIWHWKDRYRGGHSDLWGVLILVETSGWMKLVYIFRHVLPDMNHSGRYRLDPTSTVQLLNSAMAAATL